MSRKHADELLVQFNKASEEATKALCKAQHGTDAAEAARRDFDRASARHHGALTMLEAMTLPAEAAPQRDHARAFARGYVIARERALVAGDYPPEGHADHGSQPFILALCMGAAYATASVPFWEAVHRWRGHAPPPGDRLLVPEFVAQKDGDGGHLYTYHEIQDQDLALVVTDDLDADLYAGACEGREALEREEGSWPTFSVKAQDDVLWTLKEAAESEDEGGTGAHTAAARALRHLAGRTEPERKPEIGKRSCNLHDDCDAANAV